MIKTDDTTMEGEDHGPVVSTEEETEAKEREEEGNMIQKLGIIGCLPVMAKELIAYVVRTAINIITKVIPKILPWLLSMFPQLGLLNSTMGLASNIIPTEVVGNVALTTLSAASGTIGLATDAVSAVGDTASALEKAGEETLSNAMQGVGSAIGTANSVVSSAISAPIIGLTSLFGGSSQPEDQPPEPKLNPNDKYRPTLVSSSMHKPETIQPQKIEHQMEAFSSSFSLQPSGVVSSSIVHATVEPVKKVESQTHSSLLGFSF